MKALVFFRQGLHDRRDIFRSGLEATGYQCCNQVPKPEPGDVLVIWNRYGQSDQEARRFEAAGAKVIVTENGLLGKTWRAKSWYAMALTHHAGAGRWENGGPERWDRWEVPLASWREGGRELLVLAQRGIGEQAYASPRGWAEDTLLRLNRCGLLARIRPHPEGSMAPKEQPAFVDDVKEARAVVTWHSAAALSALMLGIPVWYDCPSWVGRSAGTRLTQLLANPATQPLRDSEARLSMFRNLAWGMWESAEIAQGLPFMHLLLAR